MSQLLKTLHSQIKEIRTYLVKIGSSRRKGKILITKLSESNELYTKYLSLINELSLEIKQEHISVSEAQLINTLSQDFQSLHREIVGLCTEKVTEEVSEPKLEVSFEEIFDDPSEDILLEKKEVLVKMESFNLKTALILLPSMSDTECNAKQLIDSIQYYDSLLKDNDSKTKLLQFVLKCRLSQSAKLKLNKNYSNINDLVKDMRVQLLPQKAASAIQNKLHQFRQNDLTIDEYGKNVCEMFVDLTISQANGNTDCYDILKPINEKYAIKKFADGLRNRRLSTIIAARNFESLKDAIQGAKDEEICTTSTSGDVMGMYQTRFSSYSRGRQYRHRGIRGDYNTKIFSNMGFRGNRNPNRGYVPSQSWPQQPTRSMPPRRPDSRGRYNYTRNNSRGRWIRNERMRVITNDENTKSTDKQLDENKFFRE